MSPIEPAEEMLSAYLDGEITATERVAVEGSLARSSERRALLADLAAARAAVRALPAPEAPVEFLEGLEQAVAAAALSPRDTRRWNGAPRSRLAWVAGGVAAAVLAAALVIPASDRVDPKVPAQLDAHVARASVSDDPVSELAPVAAATGGLRR
jgi:anti-sigma factor RsiW